MRQHRRFKQQRQHLASFRLPVNFRRRQRKFIFDADLLRDRFGQRICRAAIRQRLRTKANLGKSGVTTGGISAGGGGKSASVFAGTRQSCFSDGITA